MAHIVSHGIKSLGVLGAGQMGTLHNLHDTHGDLCLCILYVGLGIAYVAALRAKVPVLLHDRSDEQISKGLKFMDKLLATDVAKGKIQELDAKEARDRITIIDGARGLTGLRDVDMVVEVRL